MKLRKAFTLVEILIGAAIVIILASLATTAVIAAIRDSEVNAAYAKAQQMNNAVYAGKIAGLVPPDNLSVDELHDWLVANELLRPEPE